MTSYNYLSGFLTRKDYRNNLVDSTSYTLHMLLMLTRALSLPTTSSYYLSTLPVYYLLSLSLVSSTQSSLYYLHVH